MASDEDTATKFTHEQPAENEDEENELQVPLRGIQLKFDPRST